MNRLLVFHLHGHAGNGTRLSPSAYYLEADYSKVAVRIYAETAPDTDAKFDIFTDGVSIFTEDTGQTLNKTTGEISSWSLGSTVILPAGSNSEEDAENFNDNELTAGSWIYCEAADTGNGRDFTVILELEPSE